MSNILMPYPLQTLHLLDFLSYILLYNLYLCPKYIFKALTHSLIYLIYTQKYQKNYVIQV